MDFTTTLDMSVDGIEYNWILQVKDQFSKFIWLIPLLDKKAKTIAKAVEIWIGQNGRARRL
jgi:hypothetical protein